MAEIVDLYPKTRVIFEGMCVKCCTRQLYNTPAEMALRDIDCETCGPGFIIMTGQPLVRDDVDVTPGDGPTVLTVDPVLEREDDPA